VVFWVTGVHAVTEEPDDDLSVSDWKVAKWGMELSVLVAMHYNAGSATNGIHKNVYLLCLHQSRSLPAVPSSRPCQLLLFF
jgi:hypothetical protein